MIEFNQVSKAFPDGTKAVSGSSFIVDKGEFFVLIGPSGCGKTTTMKMINRLIDASEGTISINGSDIRSKNIHKLRWEIGYVLQQIALFPHMTIAENIAIVPELKGWDKNTVSDRIDELLQMVGLDPATYRDRMPAELSGGQQQRIGVVRALAGDPDILLMDEPFSALDPISRSQLQRDIAKLQQEIQKTIVFVTHDMEEALQLGDRIAVMKEGEIIQIASPSELIANPADEFVASFIGKKTSPWDMTLEAIDASPEAAGPSISRHTTIREAFHIMKEKNVSSLSLDQSDQHVSLEMLTGFVQQFTDHDRGEGVK
ncbi:ABC transporter ATP-binding protein [Alkalicoccus luteus]|uniref:Quaternary amine transport ATP-binding protein n=1 Tax=Alkalicoccus luteus TaxID=1237094 RepID=A0A969PN34_9BACI|nr:ABC transporter ATP-binding protein [Alkalicoccus luteus]NJP37250.1 ABC transporter ATP-binding protein [Alkalicoccus luteus]